MVSSARPAPLGLRTDRAAGFVRLTAGSVSVALPLESIRAVERGERVRGESAAPTVAAGGREIPVFALPALLGAGDEIAAGTGQVVLTEAGGETVGILAEKVSPVPRATVIARSPAPASDARFAHAILLPDGPLPLLDLGRLFRDADDAPARPPLRSARAVPDTARLVVLRQFDRGTRRVGFGVASHQTREIVYLESVTPVSGRGGTVGWTTWRGQVLPVIDPAGWCGVDAPPVSATRAAVVEPTPGRRLAVLVGDGIRSLPATAPHVRRACWLDTEPGSVDGTVEFPDLTALLLRL